MRPTAEGGWSARKVIPEDVQDDYLRLYGKKHEERFNSGRVPIVLARQNLANWFNEVETRINNIRAERTGEGRTLTEMQARALAGEWYHWWTARHLAKPWDLKSLDIGLGLYLDEMLDGTREPGELDDPPWRDPWYEWETNYEARGPARAWAADNGETSQFLHSKHLTLEPAARELFLDFVCKDLFQALELLIRRAKGDYGEDEHPKQFPKFERTADPGLTAWDLFERWIERMKPAQATVNTWRTVFLKLKEDFPNHSAEMFTTAEIKTWLEGLITENDTRVSPRSSRSARTININWKAAGKRVFGWAVDQKLISQNPFEDVHIPVPRRRTNRDTKAFTDEEIEIILRASLAVSKELLTKREATTRWVPWLCAYTGARPGEITQLRGADVIEQNGVHAIRITPEAGSVKTGKARVVPLHEHLISQGFLDFVKSSGRGPLFSSEPRRRLQEADEDITKPRKPPSVTARVYLASWVREQGITDLEVRPNHAWRHTFKQRGSRYGMREHVLDVICGHTPAYVGRGYNVPTLGDMADELKKFPRYEIE
jgi:integrase